MVKNAYLSLPHPENPRILRLAPYDDDQQLVEVIEATLANFRDGADMLPSSTLQWRIYLPSGGIIHTGIPRETTKAVRDWLAQHRDEEPVEVDILMKAVLPSTTVQNDLVNIIVTTIEGLDTLGTPFAQANKERRAMHDFGALSGNDVLDSQFKIRANVLYEAAWGKHWPREEKTLLRCDVLSVTSTTPTASSDIDMGPDPLPDIITGPTTAASDMDVDPPANLDSTASDMAMGVDPLFDLHDITYVCLKNIKILDEALDPTIRFPPVLVRLAEYEPFIQNLTETERETERETPEKRIGAVVLGHPGIGKSMFLLYLLLYRLEHKLPTAIQFNPTFYIIFDKHGVTVNHVTKLDLRLQACWALADSNAYVIQPCSPFSSLAWFVIQATSLRPERWKAWAGQNTVASKDLMDLPSMMEIAAVVKESGYEPSKAYSYVLKWGPSLRTVINICYTARIKKATNPEDTHDSNARRAALAVCADPSLILTMRNLVDSGSSDGANSNLLFVRPRRQTDGTLNRSTAQVFIPTDHLNQIVAEHSQALSNNQRLKLFEALGSHSYMRSSAGWHFEIEMHHSLCAKMIPLTFFKEDGTEMQVEPTSHLLHGTLSALQDVTTSNDFYWAPSQSTFPGVDGLFGDSKGNLFAVQATVATNHTSPLQGLAQLWKHLRAPVRRGREWHVVFFAPDRGAATHLISMEKNGGLVGEQLEYGGTVAGVWGCVLGQHALRFVQGSQGYR